MTTGNSTIWFLEDIDLHNLFCSTKRGNHASEMDHTTFKKGDYIYLSDTPSKYIYLIDQGRVKIGSYSDDGREAIKTILDSGEIFGELALVGEDKRSDFAQAIDTEVKVCILTLEQVAKLIADDKDFSLKMTKLIGFRLKRMERKFESLVFKDARTRIVEYLRDLAIEKGKKVGFEILVSHFFTHEDIGKMTATSRQTVTSVLNELKSENLINFDRRRLLIRDIKKLK